MWKCSASAVKVHEFMCCWRLAEGSWLKERNQWMKAVNCGVFRGPAWEKQQLTSWASWDLLIMKRHAGLYRVTYHESGFLVGITGLLPMCLCRSLWNAQCEHLFSSLKAFFGWSEEISACQDFEMRGPGVALRYPACWVGALNPASSFPQRTVLKIRFFLKCGVCFSLPTNNGEVNKMAFLYL